MILLIILAVTCFISLLMLLGLLFAVSATYPTMTFAEIVDAFSTDKPTPETPKKEERLDIWV